jgi:hypothetical protein
MDENKTEQLLEKEYIIVDFLPKQVTAENNGSFFDVELLFLKEPRASELRRKFADIILKLYCYYGIEVYNLSTDEMISNPEPAMLDEWICSNRDEIQIFIKESMIVIAKDDTHITVYNPSDSLTEIIGVLAEAEGLFMWKPEIAE